MPPYPLAPEQGGRESILSAIALLSIFAVSAGAAPPSTMFLQEQTLRENLNSLVNVARNVEHCAHVHEAICKPKTGTMVIMRYGHAHASTCRRTRVHVRRISR